MFGPGGSFFVWGRDEWRDERTDCQRGGCMVVPGAVVSPGHTKRLSLLPCSRPAGSLSVLVFWRCEVWWSDGRVVSHQRCAGWLQGLSFFVVCWKMVWHRRCAGCGCGEFFCGLS